MAMLCDDKSFYGMAAELAGIAQAFGPGADKLFKYLQDLRIETADSESSDLPELPNSSFPDFEYSPLTGPLAFRLLVLHPGAPSEPLKGTLKHELLRVEGRNPGSYTIPIKFEAISYVWGSESKPCSIFVNGCELKITKSLFDALVRLRYHDKSRKLWADALCINQSDKKEKAAQVALMPDIYKYSAKVLVFLGSQSDGSELVPELMGKIAALDLAKMRARKPQPTEFVSIGLPPPNDSSWKAMVHFLCRSWFSRIWIIQEVVLARDARFLCGDWELKWPLIAAVGERIDYVLPHVSEPWSDQYQLAQRSACSVALMRAMQNAISVVAGRLQDLEAEIKLAPQPPWFSTHAKGLTPDLAAERKLVVDTCREHPELFPLIERTILGLDAVNHPPTPILKLLGVFTYHQAMIPQDRLYALTSLAQDMSPEEFPADYEETEEQTNLRFTTKLVEKGQGLDVLFHSTKWELAPLNASTPSWVPSWTQRQGPMRHWLKLGWAYSQYSGGFDGRPISTEFVSLVDGKPGLLKVSGCSLDGFRTPECIVQIGLAGFKLDKFGQAAKEYFQKVQSLMTGSSYFTGESWPEVQCQTLIAGHMETIGISLAEAVQQYENEKRAFIQLKAYGRAKSKCPWGSAWFGLTPEYAACKTSRGFVGLVPAATSAGDEVFMLRGSDMPFVLRPIPTLPGYFRLIGGCYMHGLMGGEAWKRLKGNAEIFLL